LMGHNLQAWHNVVLMVAHVHLTNQRDRFVWVASKRDVLSKFHVQSIARSSGFTI
jgi:hypothetical protein